MCLGRILGLGRKKRDDARCSVFGGGIRFGALGSVEGKDELLVGVMKHL